MLSLTQQSENALFWIIDLMEQYNIDYKITGGLAAIFYGSNRSLADIDIEIDRHDFQKIMQELEKHPIKYKGNFQDENWDIYLVTIDYFGQEIDIASSYSKIFNKNKNKWEECTNDLQSYTTFQYKNKNIRFETKDFLISYKEKLQRDVDREDVEQILKMC